ncbi:hypothetical protein BgiMline_011922, partial [Biomphalaria glabrata]
MPRPIYPSLPPGRLLPFHRVSKANNLDFAYVNVFCHIVGSAAFVMDSGVPGPILIDDL